MSARAGGLRAGVVVKETERSRPAGLRARILAVVPGLAAIGLYAPSLPTAAWVLDDHAFIAARVSLAGISREWTASVAMAAGEDRASTIWRPLVTSLWRVIGAAFGADPVLVRGLNIGLQGLDAVLVGLCARVVGASPATAAAVGVAWGVHAAHVDVVAWGVGGFDLVSTGCALLAVLAAARGRPVGVALAVAAAGFAKESGVVLAAVLPLLFGTVGLAAVPAAAVVVGTHRLVTGSSAVDALPSPADLVVAWLGGLGWLVGPPAGGLFALFGGGLAPIAQGVATVGLVGLLGYAAWRGGGSGGAESRGSSGAGSRTPAEHASRALVAAGIALVPAAVAVTFTGVAPARYAHLPAALLLVFLAPVLDALPRSARAGLLGAWLVLHVPSAALRLHDWRSEDALLTAEVASDPDNPIAAAFWGRHRAAVCEADGLYAWTAALDRDPGLPFLRHDRAALAQAAFLCGRPDIAETQITRYLAAHPDAPPNAWCVRADALDALGRHAEAEVAAKGCRATSR